MLDNKLRHHYRRLFAVKPTIDTRTPKSFQILKSRRSGSKSAGVRSRSTTNLTRGSGFGSYSVKSSGRPNSSVNHRGQIPQTPIGRSEAEIPVFEAYPPQSDRLGEDILASRPLHSVSYLDLSQLRLEDDEAVAYEPLHRSEDNIELQLSGLGPQTLLNGGGLAEDPRTNMPSQTISSGLRRSHSISDKIDQFFQDVTQKETEIREEFEIKMRKVGSRVRPPWFRSLSINSSHMSRPLSTGRSGVSHKPLAGQPRFSLTGHSRLTSGRPSSVGLHHLNGGSSHLYRPTPPASTIVGSAGGFTAAGGRSRHSSTVTVPAKQQLQQQQFERSLNVHVGDYEGVSASGAEINNRPGAVANSGKQSTSTADKTANNSTSANNNSGTEDSHKELRTAVLKRQQRPQRPQTAKAVSNTAVKRPVAGRKNSGRRPKSAATMLPPEIRDIESRLKYDRNYQPARRKKRVSTTTTSPCPPHPPVQEAGDLTEQDAAQEDELPHDQGPLHHDRLQDHSQLDDQRVKDKDDLQGLEQLQADWLLEQAERVRARQISLPHGLKTHLYREAQARSAEFCRENATAGLWRAKFGAKDGHHGPEMESSRDSAYGYSAESRITTREPTPDYHRLLMLGGHGGSAYRQNSGSGQYSGLGHHGQHGGSLGSLPGRPPEETYQRRRRGSIQKVQIVENGDSRGKCDEKTKKYLSFLGAVTSDILARGIFSEKGIRDAISYQRNRSSFELTEREIETLLSQLKEELGIEKKRSGLSELLSDENSVPGDFKRPHHSGKRPPPYHSGKRLPHQPASVGQHNNRGIKASQASKKDRKELASNLDRRIINSLSEREIATMLREISLNSDTVNDILNIVKEESENSSEDGSTSPRLFNNLNISRFNISFNAGMPLNKTGPGLADRQGERGATADDRFPSETRKKGFNILRKMSEASRQSSSKDNFSDEDANRGSENHAKQRLNQSDARRTEIEDDFEEEDDDQLSDEDEEYDDDDIVDEDSERSSGRDSNYSYDEEAEEETDPEEEEVEEVDSEDEHDDDDNHTGDWSQASEVITETDTSN